MIYIEVKGTPESKGSLNAFLPRKKADTPERWLGNLPNGPFYEMADGTKRIYNAALERLPRPVVTESKKTKDWETTVQKKAIYAWENRPMIEGPVKIMLRFWMKRPKKHFKGVQLREGAPVFHTVKPDTDKLTRCILDALTGVCYKDDSQVSVPKPVKIYTEAFPRVEILIGPAKEEDLQAFNAEWFLERE